MFSNGYIIQNAKCWTSIQQTYKKFALVISVIIKQQSVIKLSADFN